MAPASAIPFSSFCYRFLWNQSCTAGALKSDIAGEWVSIQGYCIGIMAWSFLIPGTVRIRQTLTGDNL